jgi:hypothetical protein
VNVSDHVAEKALRLLEQRRVHLDDLLNRPFGDAGSTATVFGDSDMYLVDADERGVRCSCPMGGRQARACAHKVAAMLAWAERAEQESAAWARVRAIADAGLARPAGV